MKTRVCAFKNSSCFLHLTFIKFAAHAIIITTNPIYQANVHNFNFLFFEYTDKKNLFITAICAISKQYQKYQIQPHLRFLKKLCINCNASISQIPSIISVSGSGSFWLCAP